MKYLLLSAFLAGTFAVSANVQQPTIVNSGFQETSDAEVPG